MTHAFHKAVIAVCASLLLLVSYGYYVATAPSPSPYAWAVEDRSVVFCRDDDSNRGLWFNFRTSQLTDVRPYSRIDFEVFGSDAGAVYLRQPGREGLLVVSRSVPVLVNRGVDWVQTFTCFYDPSGGPEA